MRFVGAELDYQQGTWIMPQLVPPVPFGSEIDSPEMQQFLELLRRDANSPRFYAQSTRPRTYGCGKWHLVHLEEHIIWSD